MSPHGLVYFKQSYNNLSPIIDHNSRKVKNVMHLSDFSPAGMPQSNGQDPVSVVIIDYGLGNVRSVANALQALGADVKLSRDPADFKAADGLILPGVGAFGDGMAQLRDLGLIPHLNEMVLQQQKPILGICLGMQLMAQSSTEGGRLHQGLGWLAADVVRFPTDLQNSDLIHSLATDQSRAKSKKCTLKVPHVGWNDVTVRRSCPVLGLPGTVQSYYFVHSYLLQCHDLELMAGSCKYGTEFPAVVQKNNMLGVQFHPEKSQKHGLALLGNFLHVARNNRANALHRHAPQISAQRNLSTGEFQC